ncbi:uncharacterized protein A4U43_C07F3350 [Asparagus officinalis]|uniref:Homeobox domain-containing protein n=2 Tax=Asparagus officinalis TaxID=4686 RepID=A0A5P1EB08_ASPOF|nr:uncharacterized protein A4U43_C07F3350 [Asparagus officinalis]
MILEEMYRSGVRTPNASQIQQITAHLSFYGKIEGKNVFYWFQNHKARDRQKLRRRLSRQHHLLHGCSFNQYPLQTPNVQLFHNLEEASLSPTYSHLQAPLHFLHQGVPDQETSQGMNLLSKLEKGEASPPKMSHGYDYMMMMMMESSHDAHPCCKPLKTLDLFPTKSTGLKDECSTSNPSSCSTSTN